MLLYKPPPVEKPPKGEKPLPKIQPPPMEKLPKEDKTTICQTSICLTPIFIVKFPIAKGCSYQLFTCLQLTLPTRFFRIFIQHIIHFFFSLFLLQHVTPFEDFLYIFEMIRTHGMFKKLLISSKKAIVFEVHFENVMRNNQFELHWKMSKPSKYCSVSMSSEIMGSGLNAES